MVGAELRQSGPLSSRQIDFLVIDRWWSIVVRHVVYGCVDK